MFLAADVWLVSCNRNYDGPVNKYVIQSMFSGTANCVFMFEVFSESTKTLQEQNDFFNQKGQISHESDMIDEQIVH